MWRPSTEAKRKVVAAYDDFADGYDEAYTDSAALAENDWLRDKLDHIVNGHGPGHVLDIGCGTGFMFELLPVDPSNYTGIDLSPKMLEHAREKYPEHTFVEHDMEEPWPVTPGSIDTAVSLWSFNYSFNPMATIANLARALRPGGRFLFIVYSERWPDRHTYVEQRHILRHLYTKRHLRDLFDPESFSDVEVQPLSRWVDLVKHAPLPIARVTLRAEAATILRIAPDQAYYYWAQGRRR